MKWAKKKKLLTFSNPTTLPLTCVYMILYKSSHYTMNVTEPRRRVKSLQLAQLCEMWCPVRFHCFT